MQWEYMKINLEDWADNSTSSSGIWSAMKQGYSEGLATEEDEPPPPTPPTTSTSEVINKLGKDGWELVSVVRAVPSVSDYFYLKRLLK